VQTNTVPTTAERVGDFSSLLKIGSQYQIYDPFSTVVLRLGQTLRQRSAAG